MISGRYYPHLLQNNTIRFA